MAFIAIAHLYACAPVQSPASHTTPGVGVASEKSARASVFAYPWVWTDEQGKRVAFSQWRGETLVVTAIYTWCKSTCPRTIGKLQKIHDTFGREGRPAQFFLVTLDPVSDTPEVLRRFKVAERFPDTWHLLAGSLAQTKDLTDVLDIHLIDDGPHLMHDSKIVVFDGQGIATRSFGGWALDDET